MERDKAIDIAKGLGIILVVFGHNWIVLYHRGNLFNVIFSFHVPLFFVLSGMFFKANESLKSTIVSRANALLKPYFVVLFLVLAKNSIQTMDFDTQTFWVIIYGNGKTLGWVPMWFLPHLFAVSAFSAVVLKLLGKIPVSQKATVAFAAAFLLVGVWGIKMFWEIKVPFLPGMDFLPVKDNLLPGLPFSLDIVLITSAFFLGGYALSKRIRSFKPGGVGLIAAALVFIGLHVLLNETMDLNMRYYGNVMVSSLQAIA
jgi:polysaccharide biosynthesis protein PslL